MLQISLTVDCECWKFENIEKSLFFFISTSLNQWGIVFKHKPFLLGNYWTDFNEVWHEY